MTDYQISSERQKVSPLFQSLLIFIFATIIATSFWLRMDYFRTLEQRIGIQSLTPAKFREFGGYSDEVKVGLEIDRFHEFNIIKNKFEFAGNLWFEFDAGAFSIETLDNFAFDRGQINYRSEPEIKLNGHRLFVRYVIKVSFNTELNFRDFPVDDHRVNLVLTHPFISPEDIVFEAQSTNFVLLGNLLPFGWRTIGTAVKTGFLEENLSQISSENKIVQPVATFSIDVERYGGRYALSILLPIILMYFLMYFALSVDANPSISIALAGITAMVAYRFVIEQLSPASGDLMLSDHFFFLLLTSGMLIFLLNKLDLYISPINMKKKKIAILAIHGFTAILSFTLLVPT